MRMMTLGQESSDVDRAIEIQCGVPVFDTISEIEVLSPAQNEGVDAQSVADVEPAPSDSGLISPEVKPGAVMPGATAATGADRTPVLIAILSAVSLLF